eukprot:TRINITY_DN59110_c0_g1_i1.p1 TRINITY_DN59110_c0_g1~~TRINITY_DN59110_c0_g1_i1.p1  ORF type:complete len:616 (-),score=89.80 TRINITY_DN59110_c0_g1_i1:39-1886(-)
MAWCLGRLLVASVLVGTESAWYDGIDTIKVLSPEDSSNQQTIDDIFRRMAEDPPAALPFKVIGKDKNMTIPFRGQFGTNRQAVLLRRGDYGRLEIPVNFYTSVHGVGSGPDDVKVSRIKANDTYPHSAKGGLENFWRSVEGLSCTASNVTWAVSQAAPLRRVQISGDLYLSQQQGDEVHYTSGGFMADISVGGTLHWGTQQQFFFRNAEFESVEYSGAGRSFVFVGVEGAPIYNKTQPTPYISAVGKTPIVAEKPYLVEDQGNWQIVVPDRLENMGPGPSWQSGNSYSSKSIQMEDVFVAKDGDNSTTISAGIKGKRALLLTPAMYFLHESIRIADPDFVVLGIGMPTLVTLTGLSAIIVDAPRVRIAHVLIEGSHPRTSDPTSALLLWKGSDGVASDIFTRVGAFAYEKGGHDSCTVTHADVHLEARGDRLVLDNAWLWHADHDDCTGDSDYPKSDIAYSGNGLTVYGENVTAYGLAVEHTMMDLVDWSGEGGQIFFFQSELPYNDPTFVDDGYCGYKVGYDVKRHTAYGVGIYQVFPTYTLKADMRVPPVADLTNVFAWSITSGFNTTLGKLICDMPGDDNCHKGECDANSCHIAKFPIPSVRSPSMNAAVFI